MNSTVVWVGIIGIVIAVLSALYAAYSWERRRMIENDDLNYLDELVREHALGIADSRRDIEWLIEMIEKTHWRSDYLPLRLDHARRILRDNPQS
jgi:hypothetical protein